MKILGIIVLLNGCLEKQPVVEDYLEETPSQEELIVEDTEKEVSEEALVCDRWGDFYIGDFCCKETEEIFLCKQDVNDYLVKLEIAKKEWDTSEKVIKLENPKVSFQQPEGWKVMRNYKAGIFDVPISYFIEDGSDFYEIRLLYYDKGDLSLKEIEEAIFKMISKRGELRRGSDTVKVYDMEGTWIDESYRFVINYCIDRYGGCSDDDNFIYYDVEISPYKDKYYIWSYRDPSYRVYSGSMDKKVNQYNEIIMSFNFIEGTKFTKEANFKDDYAWYFGLSFVNPTTIKYNISSEGSMDVYFVEEYEDFEDYLARGYKNEKRFDFYEDCKYKAVKEAKGECIMTTGGLLIANNKDGFNNIKINLDWSS